MLSSFPPKNAKVEIAQDKYPSLSAVAMTPATALAQSDIWLAELRGGLKQPRYKKKDIDKRKSDV
jgi:ribonuclease P/MRP protein subunit POP1